MASSAPIAATAAVSLCRHEAAAAARQRGQDAPGLILLAYTVLVAVFFLTTLYWGRSPFSLGANQPFLGPDTIPPLRHGHHEPPAGVKTFFA